MGSRTMFSLTGTPSPNGGANGSSSGSREASDRGARSHLEGDLEGAKAAYLAALELDRDNATAHNNLGFLLAQEGKLEEAVRHYERALEIDPRKSMAMVNLGIARVAQDDEEAALQWLQKAVEADSSNLLAWDNLGRLLLKMGRLAEAEAAARAALELAPHDDRLHLALGLAVAGQQRLTEAVEILRRAVQLDSSQPTPGNSWASFSSCARTSARPAMPCDAP